jgi:hypothetical protein
VNSVYVCFIGTFTGRGYTIIDLSGPSLVVTYTTVNLFGPLLVVAYTIVDLLHLYWSRAYGLNFHWLGP